MKIVDETQVEFICASRVRKLRCATLLEEGDLAIYTDGGKQWRHKAGNKVLHRTSRRPLSTRVNAYEQSNKCRPRIYRY